MANLANGDQQMVNLADGDQQMVNLANGDQQMVNLANGDQQMVNLANGDQQMVNLIYGDEDEDDDDDDANDGSTAIRFQIDDDDDINFDDDDDDDTEVGRSGESSRFFETVEKMALEDRERFMSSARQLVQRRVKGTKIDDISGVTIAVADHPDDRHLNDLRIQFAKSMFLQRKFIRMNSGFISPKECKAVSSEGLI